MAMPSPTLVSSGVAHAIHPHDGTVVHTVVTARFLVNDARSGAFVAEHKLPIGQGYCHDA